jgi:hypothetical protein
MKRLAGLLFAAAVSFAGVAPVQAAPAGAAGHVMAEQAREAGKLLTSEVGWRRGGGGYRRAHFGGHRRGHFRHAGFYGHRRFHGHHYGYRPVRYRPVFVGAPVVVGAGYGYGPRCVWRPRWVHTYYGVERRLVRKCFW